jgi:hypothetical protein
MEDEDRIKFLYDIFRWHDSSQDAPMWKLCGLLRGFHISRLYTQRQKTYNIKTLYYCILVGSRYEIGEKVPGEEEINCLGLNMFEKNKLAFERIFGVDVFAQETVNRNNSIITKLTPLEWNYEFEICVQKESMNNMMRILREIEWNVRDIAPFEKLCAKYDETKTLEMEFACTALLIFEILKSRHSYRNAAMICASKELSDYFFERKIPKKSASEWLLCRIRIRLKEIDQCNQIKESEYHSSLINSVFTIQVVRYWNSSKDKIKLLNN